ncbi:MAG TPA: hypothetical protein VF453_06670 [Burkholderiaceae bacterium]
MSYSFTIRAANKAEAKNSVAAKLAEVVRHQSTHAVDQDKAYAAACAFIDALVDDDTRDIHVGMYGNVTTSGAGVIGAGVNVSASLADRTA